jgi:hypothetical protein
MCSNGFWCRRSDIEGADGDGGVGGGDREGSTLEEGEG